jgi:L-ascorbate metabolism protein UlaG (beta-lactamase superfamily)
MQSVIRIRSVGLSVSSTTKFSALNTSVARFSTKMAAPLAVVTATSPPGSRPEAYNSKPHHDLKTALYKNPWDSYNHLSLGTIWKWVFWDSLTGKRHNPDTTPPTVTVRKPTFLPTRQTEKLRATWLGHACYFVEFPGGLRVLFDPVFEERCSPSWVPGPKRFTEMPCKIEDIPFIDAVVISHNHYDHLSHPTVMGIRKNFPNAHFFVPLGNKQWFDALKIPNVTESDWWDQSSFTLSTHDDNNNQTEITATFSCLPCQHQSARTAFDRCKSLWASWSVSSGDRNVFFGGDTGYRSVPQLPQNEFDYSEKYSHLPCCPAFKEVGEHRGPFDFGMIPIGAYKPRHLMSPVHANPYDSVNIFVDTKCKRAMGIHWGTWVLTEEEVLEPPRLLKEALEWKGLPRDGVFDVCDIGESREF